MQGSKKPHHDTSDGEGRNPYQAPALVIYGKIRNLTASGSGKDTENSGKDDANNMKKMP